VTDLPTEIGLIAGNRSLPLEFARLGRARGLRRIVAVGVPGETDPALAALVDEMHWLRVGQLGKMIRTFAARGVRHCVMLGQIAPRNLFELRPDLRTLRVLFRLRERNAHTLFGAVAEELQRDGITLISALPWLEPLLPEPGFCVGPGLTASQREDLAYGRRIALEVARLEIGQTVVVKRGTVLAVEGFEGTDACLARGGALAGPRGGAVAVKLAKPDHDLRFDIPTVGLQTVETCAAHGVAVLGLEARRALLLEREQIVACARQRRVTVCTLD
jgi:hypothetical protein